MITRNPQLPALQGTKESTDAWSDDDFPDNVSSALRTRDAYTRMDYFKLEGANVKRAFHHAIDYILLEETMPLES